jgi:hypothetical protein
VAQGMRMNLRFFKSVHVGVAVGYRSDRPWVSARRHHRVDQEAPDAAVAIHTRMNVDEDKVPEHDADGPVRLFPQQVEERRHGVPPRVPVQRHLHRLADIDLAVAVAREIGGFSRPMVTLGANSSRYHVPWSASATSP